MTFIVDNIASEGGLTANTFFVTTLSSNSISATTYYGNASSLNVAINLDDVANKAVLYNNNGFLSGSTNFTYDGSTLFLTGNSRFNGSFFLNNSPSAKIQYRWDGSKTVGGTPGIVWSNMPAAITTWLGATSTVTGDATYITDLTEYSQYRFYFTVQAAGTNGSQLRVQNSLNNSTWFDLASVTISIAGSTTGAKDSGWLPIPLSARTFTYIRLIGSGGNGAADPRFSPPTLAFR